MNTININDKITRIEGDSTVYGDKGTVIEQDENGRCRVLWESTNRRTWIKAASISNTAVVTTEMIQQAKTASNLRWSKKYGHLR